MSAFSSLLSSLDKTAQPSQPSGAAQRPKPPTQTLAKPAGSANPVKLTPNNAAAGVKRKADDGAAESVKNVNPARPTTAGGRFQLTAKGKTTEKPTVNSPKPGSSAVNPAKPHRPTTTLPPKITPVGNSSSSAPASATPTTATTSKKGFAALLEKAKSAQAAAAASAGGIKHKPMEKMTRKERLKLMEEHKAAKKAGGIKAVLADRSRSGTPAGPAGKGAPVKTGYQGTMKKVIAPAEPAYKGTMRAVSAGGAKPKPKEGQRRANEYVDWSDLDEEQDDYGDEEEEDYGSDVSDDMEGGFDDMQEEEELALRAARKEDMDALREEERLKQEKLARKRKLQELSKSAAAKKRY